MNCPFCTNETKVLESRMSEKAVRRRRECLKCANRFTTFEKAEFHFLVHKKDGREEPFNLAKISTSIEKACVKIEPSELEKITTKVEHKILAKKQGKIKTTEIGKIVLSELRKYDKIAYLRFATVHKAIEDPKILQKELHLIS